MSDLLPDVELDDEFTYDGLPTLEVGSVAAQALLTAWQGTPATSVTSPPGAGKSRLLTTVASHLAVRGQMRVAIACQTTIQARDLANRFAEVAPAAPVVLLGRSNGERPSGLAESVKYGRRVKDLPNSEPVVAIATTAKWAYANPDDFFADILLVDEAYQATWKAFTLAVPVSRQVLLVGDPGQIPPVVTGDMSRYQRMAVPPYLPAPDALERMQGDNLVSYQLPDTWRCGATTAKVLQPLYPFAFGSRRPDQHLAVRGAALPEIGMLRVESHGSPVASDLMGAIVTRIEDLLDGGVLHEPDGTTSPLTPADIAVVVPHNAQVSSVRARLGRIDGGLDVTVATTERLQGAEYPVVVALSPLAGKSTLSEFDTQPGRLCVMLSRHTKHLTFVERHDSRARFEAHCKVTTNKDTAQLAAVHELLDELAPTLALPVAAA